ncbi:MAG: thiol-disulfide isomerase/thioredoxin [Parasphingorhabdus sp.]|jgi:thiol-disulfide isomerase/thioredoxin
MNNLKFMIRQKNDRIHSQRFLNCLINALVLIGLMAIMTKLVDAQTAASSLGESLNYISGTPLANTIELPTLDDTIYSLSDYRGKVVVVNFWATWCPPCVEEFPSMQGLWDRLDQSDFEILAINVGEDNDDIRRFLTRFDPTIEFPILLDRSMNTLQNWGVFGLPTTFIINNQGQLVFRATGGRDMNSDHIRKKITELIRK